MAFGHWMEITEGDVRLRMGPISRDDMPRFVAAEAGHGMQSYEVVRYLGFSLPPTPEGELAWWDKESENQQRLSWGIYLPDGDDWKLVGSTSITLGHLDRRKGETGCLIFDRTAWGQRVASTAHLGRTKYAFDELDVLALTSGAFHPNTGSNKALQGVGYVQTGTRHAASIAGGETLDLNEYLLVNPAEEAWRFFWRRPDEDIPPELHAGREVARRALERAATAVRFL